MDARRHERTTILPSKKLRKTN